MARFVCRVLIPDTLEVAFLFVVELLKTVGVSLANPGNAKITTWTDDGDQIEVLAATLAGEVNSGNIHCVQFWKTESEDVFVAWKQERLGWSFTFYLDGVDADIAVVLTSKLAEAVLTKYRTRYGDGDALTIALE